MQELISTFHLYQNSGCTQEEHELLSFYIKCAENLLEKEKEQIIDAMNHWKEQESNAFDDDFVWTGEEYYNKMYNNK